MRKNSASVAQSVPAAQPASFAPPVGGFREIDGRRVFVYRMGGGGPAVVFLPGAGAVGLDYFAVQRGVSQFSTAVVYDRCGSGYSDRVPLPRTAAAVATELHEVLGAEGLAEPVVLVAHSLGGAHAHRFAQLYPDKVAGLVWLDGFHRDWQGFLPAAVTQTVGEQAAPSSEQIRQLRPALREMYAELVADYPQHMRQPLIDAHGSEEWFRVGVAERGSLVALAEELRAGPGLPDVPLIAISVEGTGIGPQARMPEETLLAIREGMRNMAAAVADAVPSGEHRVVSGVGHDQLCFLRPEVVVQAVRDVLERAGCA
ncbi:MAG: alpha/beta hydrolase [Catenulispora sp.]|nr:alpha/beta hydrolase [Catenulispora sp.]